MQSERCRYADLSPDQRQQVLLGLCLSGVAIHLAEQGAFRLAPVPEVFDDILIPTTLACWTRLTPEHQASVMREARSLAEADFDHHWNGFEPTVANVLWWALHCVSLHCEGEIGVVSLQQHGPNPEL